MNVRTKRRLPIMCCSLLTWMMLTSAVVSASELEREVNTAIAVVDGPSSPQGVRLGIETTHPSGRIDTRISLPLPLLRRGNNGEDGRTAATMGIENVLVAVPTTYIASSGTGTTEHDLTLGIAAVLQTARDIRFTTVAQGRVIGTPAPALSFVGIITVPAGPQVTLIGGAAYMPDSPSAFPVPLFGVRWTPFSWLSLQVLLPSRVELSVTANKRLSAALATGIAPDPVDPDAGSTITGSAAAFFRATSQLVFGLEGRLSVPVAAPAGGSSADRPSTNTIAFSLTVTPAGGAKQ